MQTVGWIRWREERQGWKGSVEHGQVSRFRREKQTRCALITWLPGMLGRYSFTLCHADWTAVKLSLSLSLWLSLSHFIFISIPSTVEKGEKEIKRRENGDTHQVLVGSIPTYLVRMEYLVDQPINGNENPNPIATTSSRASMWLQCGFNAEKRNKAPTKNPKNPW